MKTLLAAIAMLILSACDNGIKDGLDKVRSGEFVWSICNFKEDGSKDCRVLTLAEREYLISLSSWGDK